MSLTLMTHSTAIEVERRTDYGRLEQLRAVLSLRYKSLSPAENHTRQS